MGKNKRLFLTFLVLITAVFAGFNNVKAADICKYSLNGFMDIKYAHSQWILIRPADSQIVGDYKTVFNVDETDWKKRYEVNFPQEKDFNSCPYICKVQKENDDEIRYGFAMKTEDCDDYKWGYYTGRSKVHYTAISATEFDIFSKIKTNYFNDDKLKEYVNSMTPESYATNPNGSWNTNYLSVYLANKIYPQIKEAYFPDEEQIPEFIKTFISGLLSENSERITELFKEKLEADKNSGALSQEDYDRILAQLDGLDWGDGTGHSGGGGGDTGLGSEVHNPVDETDCYSILGESMTQLVKTILTFLRFLGPALVIVFTIIEFVKAVFDPEVTVSKPLGRLIKRLIAAAALFFLPSLILPLFSYLHITLSETCMNFLS